MTSDVMTSEEWIAKVRSALLPLRIDDGSDRVQRDGQRRAAVLCPLVLRAGEWHVILTQRPETMPSHAGQIAFPGGKAEDGERAMAAALRETEEEIGVGAADIELMGRLPSFNAASSYRISPFVGIVDPSAVITPDPHEVADVFEVPLSFLMSPQNHIERRVQFEQAEHILFDMPYTGPDDVFRNIWGMTAMMLYRIWQRGFQA